MGNKIRVSEYPRMHRSSTRRQMQIRASQNTRLGCLYRIILYDRSRRKHESLYRHRIIWRHLAPSIRFLARLANILANTRHSQIIPLYDISGSRRGDLRIRAIYGGRFEPRFVLHNGFQIGLDGSHDKRMGGVFGRSEGCHKGIHLPVHRIVFDFIRFRIILVIRIIADILLLRQLVVYIQEDGIGVVGRHNDIIEFLLDRGYGGNPFGNVGQGFQVVQQGFMIGR